MVATEERKIAARDKAVHQQEEADRAKAPSNKPGPTQAKGKENKDKIVRETKSAGKIDRKEAEAVEAKNQQRQSEK